MTQRNISRATSRITECLFHVVVFVFLILFDSDDYYAKESEKSPL